MQEYLCLQFAKSSYIVYLGILYTLFGILFALSYSSIMEYIYPSHNDVIHLFDKDPNEFFKSNKNILNLIISTLIDVSMVVFIAYIIRKIVKRLPFGLNGVCNFDRKIVKEINGGVILSAAVMTYYSVVDKLRIYKFLWEKDTKNFIITVILFLILVFFISNINTIFDHLKINPFNN